MESKIVITCGTCANNDDGFCDLLGYLVDDEDTPRCKAAWEMKHNVKYNVIKTVDKEK